MNNLRTYRTYLPVANLAPVNPFFGICQDWKGHDVGVFHKLSMTS